MMTRPIVIPEQLHSILERFVIGVLQDKPDDILAFASDYFKKELMSRSELSEMNGRKISPARPRTDSNCSNSEDSPSVALLRKRSQRGRRQAVAAESYSPNDEIDLDKIASYPKTPEQLKCLQNAVQDIVLFKSCDPSQLRIVLNAMFQRSVKTGEVVIRQGDDGDNFYVVQDGVYGVIINGTRVACFDNKGSFGELALMYNCPRAATITAECDGVLWCLDQMTFRKILVSATASRRKKFEDLLESVPVLSELTAYERMNLADALEIRHFEDGSLIIKQNDEADNMYFVVNGETKIVVTEKTSQNSSEREVARCKSGQYFGELALVMKSPRSASVYAVGSCTCAVLDVAAFERLLGPCVEIMKRDFGRYEEERKQLGLTSIK